MTPVGKPTVGPRTAGQQGTRTGEPLALRQVRDSAQALLTEGKVDEAFEFVVSALDAVLRKTRDLELLVAKLRREQVGKRSERIDPAQLQLLFEMLCSQSSETQADPAPAIDPEAEVREDAELDREIKEAEQAQEQDKGQRKRRRRVRTAAVERQVHQLEVAESERTCKQCGVAKDRIGEDITHRLEYVPGRFIEHEYHQEKWACGTCKDGVTTAEAPDQVIERSPADASVLAHVVVSKMVDHCPLHRLHRIFARSGVDIPVSTMSDWMGEVADLIEPLAGRLAERVLAAYIDQTDATGVKVLDPATPENIQRGTIWCYVGDELDVVFRYNADGRRGHRSVGISGSPHRIRTGRRRDGLRPRLQRSGGLGDRGWVLVARTSEAERPAGHGLPRRLPAEADRAALPHRAPGGCEGALTRRARGAPASALTASAR
jgi:transposase